MSGTVKINKMTEEKTETVKDVMIGSMVTYQSNPKRDSREMGTHSSPKECPAIIVREGKHDGTLNLTVFVDNQGVSDSFHHGTGTISRMNVPHESNAEEQIGCWKKREAPVQEVQINVENLSQEVVERAKAILNQGWTPVEETKSTSSTNQDEKLDYAQAKKIALDRGYDKKAGLGADKIHEFLHQYEVAYAKAISNGFNAEENPDPKIDQLNAFMVQASKSEEEE